MKIEQSTLKNNLKTIFIDSPGNTAGSVQIWFRAGSALENHDNEGIAHFLEHMFFKGTPTRPGAAIAHEVESYGGEINAFTSFDYTCYYINSPKNHLVKTVDILLDMVSNPEFKQEDLLPERDVVFEEYRRSQDNPNHYSFQKIQKNVFTQGYAHPILGREDTIKNFSREQLNDFRNKFYNHQNAFFVISGDLSQKGKILETIEKYNLPKGSTSSFPEFELKKSSHIDVHQKDVKMTQLNLIIQAPEYDSNNAPAEDLALSCLGHGESSRLYKSLVINDSIANSTSSSTMFMQKGGLHFIRVSFPHKNIDKVLKTLNATIKDVFLNGFEKEELQKIKNQYIASKVYDMESIESFAFSIGHGYAQTQDIEGEEKFLNRVKKVSLSKVNGAFQDILKKNIHISVQIPKEEKADSTKTKVKSFYTKLANVSKAKNKSKSKYKSKGSKFDSQVQLITLKSGVELLYRYNPMNPTFVLHGYLRGGLSSETAKNNGIYTLLGNSLCKGYGKINLEKLKIDLDDKSASLNGFSGKNAYGIMMHAQSEHFSDLMKHFTGSFLTPGLAAKTLKHEKQMVLRTLEAQTEDPIRICFNRVAEVFFKGHPYSMNNLGDKKVINKITSKSLGDLHKKNLKSSPLLFTYCGDMELDEVIEALSPLTEKLPSRKSSKPKMKKVTKAKKQEHHIDLHREQTQIFHGTNCGGFNTKDNIYLKMINAHLSGQSSELFVEVRDRQGLCYTAQPIHFVALEGGYFGIYMASGHDKVKAAIEAIKGIIDKIRTNGLTQNEFDRIKKMIEGQNQIQVQTNDDYASIYSVPVLQGYSLDYFHLNNEKISNVTYEDFQTQIKKILSGSWSTFTVGR